MADEAQTDEVQPDLMQAEGQAAVQSDSQPDTATQPAAPDAQPDILTRLDDANSTDASSRAAAAKYDASASKHLDVFSYMLDIGEAMLTSGADVHTVEHSLVRMGKAYGAYKMNVLVITAVIIVTVTLPGNFEKTLSRRIENEGSTDFDRLEALSKLCDECCANPMPARELRRRLDRIKGKKFPKISLYLGGAFSAGGFALFFGGTPLDGIMSALFALVVCFALKHFRPLTPNTIVFNFATSLVIGVIICLVARFVTGMSIDIAIIGVIMLLIPGVAMTNATRDMLSGDTISGVMRFIESLLWATSLALGFMAALWLASLVG